MSLALQACTALPGAMDARDESDEGGPESSSGAVDDAPAPESSSDEGDVPDDDTSSDGADEDTGDDDTHPPAACDPWAQDCPAGEKCMPYERDPVDTFVWDALGCFPVSANAKEPGDACTAIESGVSGMDDCAMGAMCMGVDDETLQGVCIAMCEGTPAAPSCADTSNTCIIANDGVILVCLPQCDPLAPDCAEGEGCYESGTGGFFCFSQDENATGDAAYGEPCMTLNYCNPGLMCAAAATVPDCADEYCCTEFCDVSGGPDQCSGDGQLCLPYFAVDAAPPGFTDVGVCSIPQ